MAKTTYKKIGPFQYWKCRSEVRICAWDKDLHLKIGGIHYLFGIKLDLRLS